MSTVQLGHGRGWASAAAGASILRIDAQLGRLADINEAGRSREKADENYRKWLDYLAGGPWAPFALPADKSVHVTGDAADSDDWYDPAAAAVWRDNGWRQTARYPGNPKKDEPWHGEYFAHLDNHRNDPPPTPPVPEEDDMKAIIKSGAPNSGIIIQAGVPPYSIPEQTFQALCSVYGITPLEVPDWKYDTVVREQWTAFSTAQAFAANRSLSQTDIDKIAARTREELTKETP
ncbi:MULTISPECIES: hypothetical protein [unclassified Microbacterium]|uniref:hypothetical protein n=1 Tax=unclassified Microbacterium TaxID=2609290 RepID=UPI00342EEBFE